MALIDLRTVIVMPHREQALAIDAADDSARRKLGG
jgi:hypothetical protein